MINHLRELVMGDFEVWKSYIDALDILTNQYSEPFDIKVLEAKNDSSVVCRYIDNNQRDKIFEGLLKVFPSLLKENVNYQDNYLLYPSTEAINNSKIEGLKTFADSNHFEFSSKPAFSGTFKYNCTPLIDFFNNYRHRFDFRFGSTDQFLTLDEIDDVQNTIDNHSEIYIEDSYAAISNIKPSNIYYERLKAKIYNSLSKKSIVKYDIKNLKSKILVHNVFLYDNLFNNLYEETGLVNVSNNLRIEISSADVQELILLSRSGKICFSSTDTEDYSGIVIPNIENGNQLTFRLKGHLTHEDLRNEIELTLLIFKRTFNCNIKSIKNVTSIFEFDKQRFFENIKEVIPYEEFQISSDKETISFDFKTKEELDEKLQKLDSYDSLNYLGFRDDHKYKVTFGSITPLFLIKEELDKLNFVKSILNESGNELRIFGLMRTLDDLEIFKARIINSTGNFMENNITLSWENIDEGFLKYYFRYDIKSYMEEVHKKLANLRGEPLTLVDSKEVLGVLKSISYPNITLLVEDKSLLEEGAYLSVKSALKGEKDKVKRLRDAVEKIYSDSGNSICNQNLKQALIDSSSLESFIDGDITRTCEYQDLYQKVNSDLLSPYVNERQKEAIVKCLLSDDLFIVQGPPGTGKSTAIAELIWQHLANNDSDKRYRILVTSETNLAVDNALDKLRSKSHLLMKPIRFGSEEKLDDEGRRFSLEAINYWKKNEWEANDSLILDDWVDLINTRCTNQSNDSFIALWKEHLSEKGQLLRENVYSSYVKNCNVIGATCSSIGKINSEGKFTRFFQDYSNVLYPDEFERFKSSPSRSSATSLKSKEIEFELAIQDEASKASPPELVLPFTFGKKAVIIGDHRQLPPMVDTNEFIESLVYLKDKSKDDKQVKKITKLIRFIKQYRESFEHSHFEKLFTNIDTNLKSTFDTQYRMHPAINETIKQFYKGDFEDGKDLECGLPLDSIDDPNLNNPMSRYHGITKKKDTHVMWFDVRTPEIKKGTSRINPGEVKAIEWIINTITSNENYSTFINHWKDNEKDQKELGVITFYGAQAGLIKKNVPEGIDVRVSPVDRFQGMERNIVIVSLVRSNNIAESENEIADFEMYPENGYAQNESLGFAESPNRLNVALSRAKRLLIVVGNSKHFSKKEIYKNVFKTIKNHTQGEV